MTKTETLDALLEGCEISDFSRRWLETSNTNEENIRCTYKTLKRIGLTDDKIASQVHLLGRDPETIERNYLALSKLGLKDDKIASRANLLGMNPETIGRNYQHHVGLLRQNYEDRDSGRDLLISQAQFLGIPPETINSNVQYLASIGIDYNNPVLLLGTTSQLKRRKMAWLLREVFDYREAPENRRLEIIQRMYEFVRENPLYLVKSISALERARNKIRQKIS